MFQVSLPLPPSLPHYSVVTTLPQDHAFADSKRFVGGSIGALHVATFAVADTTAGIREQAVANRVPPGRVTRAVMELAEEAVLSSDEEHPDAIEAVDEAPGEPPSPPAIGSQRTPAPVVNAPLPPSVVKIDEEEPDSSDDDPTTDTVVPFDSSPLNPRAVASTDLALMSAGLDEDAPSSDDEEVTTTKSSSIEISQRPAALEHMRPPALGHANSTLTPTAPPTPPPARDSPGAASRPNPARRLLSPDGKPVASTGAEQKVDSVVTVEAQDQGSMDERKQEVMRAESPGGSLVLHLRADAPPPLAVHASAAAHDAAGTDSQRARAEASEELHIQTPPPPPANVASFRQKARAAAAGGRETEEGQTGYDQVPGMMPSPDGAPYAAGSVPRQGAGEGESAEDTFEQLKRSDSTATGKGNVGLGSESGWGDASMELAASQAAGDNMSVVDTGYGGRGGSGDAVAVGTGVCDVGVDAVVDMRAWEFKLLDVAGGQLQGFGEGLFEGEDAAMAYQSTQRSRLYQIQQLKASLAATEVRQYAEELQEFDFGDTAVTLGSISQDELAAQHARVADEEVRFRREQRQLHRRRQDILHRQEQQAIAAVMQERDALARDRVLVEEERLAKDRTRSRAARNALRSAQDRIVHALRRRGLALKQQLGVLDVNVDGRGHLLPSAKKWRLSAALKASPRPIKIRIDTCRVLRDKIPRGHYVVVATLLSRLAGQPLHYRGAGAQRLTSTRTRPVAHDGRYFDADLVVGECIFLLCPPDTQLSPSLTLLLEIYECKSRLTPVDRCVGWAVFPLVSADFELISGKFKAPVMRGEYSADMRLHRSIEQRYASDLDAWLGNIYFKVSRMSRYLHADSEYAVRLQYTSKLLGLDAPAAQLPSGGEGAGSGQDPDEQGRVEAIADGGSELTEIAIDGGEGLGSEGRERNATGAALGAQVGLDADGGSGLSADAGGKEVLPEVGVRTGQLQQIHARYGSRSEAATEKRGWWAEWGSKLWWTRAKEDAPAHERQWLLAEDGQGASTQEKARGHTGVVEWQQIFESEKAKIEAGEDPEGDGLTDVSDSEDDEEAEPWGDKDAAARILSRSAMLRTEGGATLRLPAGPAEMATRSREFRGRSLRSVVGRGARAGRDAGDDASGSDSDVGFEDEMEAPHAERFVARPVDHGRKELSHTAGAGQDTVQAAVARAAAEGDIPEVELEGASAAGLGRERNTGNKAKNPAPTAGWGRGAKAAVRDMLDHSNKGKSCGDVVGNSQPEALEVVKYDRRLANYLNSVAGSVHTRKRSSPTRFLLFEVASDLGLLSFPRGRFWGALALITMGFELRMHTHYAANFAWLFLSSRPIYKAVPGLLRWDIRYSPISTTSPVEIGSLCSGPVAVFVLWLVCSAVVWALSKTTRVDGLVYRFVGLFGLLAALDWVLVLAIDMATLSFQPCSPLWNKNGTIVDGVQLPPQAVDGIEQRAWLKEAAERCTVEAFRLWFHFRFNEGNGSIAPVIVVILYAGMLSVMLVVLYTYFLNVHLDGRILDLYRRVTCKEGTLFLPLDVELSPQELLQILSSARRWRGRDGGRRRLVVTDIEIAYTLPGGVGLGGGEVKRVLTHLALYTCPLHGATQLHRHFLRLHNGTIVEVIGDEVQYIVSPALLKHVEGIVSDYLQDGGAFVKDRKRQLAS